jgi:predicted nucleic-acid-binding Zn-ribbon protein
MTFETCRFGNRVSTCYHVPRCGHQIAGDKSSPFGRYVPDTDQAQADSGGACPDPVVHNLHTDGRYMFESCPECGGNDPIPGATAAKADAERDFADVAARTFPAGTCQGCGSGEAGLVRWAGKRYCWGCADLQLDLLAMALQDAPVSVGGLR